MVTIISPHVDDAVLSIGGTIACLRQHGDEVMVRSVFTKSSWTNPESLSQKRYEPDIDEVTALREQEEVNASRVLDYRFELMNFTDAALRDGTTDRPLFDEVKERIRSSIARDSLTFFPLGLQHHDHILIGRIAFDLYSDGYPVLLYEDLPYAAFAKDDYIRRYDSLHSDKDLTPLTIKIDFALKSKAIQQYSSQISPQWLRDVMNYCYDLRDNCFYERIWKPKGVEVRWRFL